MRSNFQVSSSSESASAFWKVVSEARLGHHLKKTLSPSQQQFSGFLVFIIFPSVAHLHAIFQHFWKYLRILTRQRGQSIYSNSKLCGSLPSVKAWRLLTKLRICFCICPQMFHTWCVACRWPRTKVQSLPIRVVQAQTEKSLTSALRSTNWRWVRSIGHHLVAKKWDKSRFARF